ncbi:MAG: S8/S53 family peptidase [Anaerolineae bacterium]|nr:S8/S53 family peptidase [Anaerolineae bacterium]
MPPETSNPADKSRDVDIPRNAYFVVGEIILHAQYKNNPDPKQLPNPDELTKWVENLLNQDDNLTNLAYKVLSSSSFTIKNNEFAASIVHISIESLRQADEDSHEVLKDKDVKLINIVRQINLLRNPVIINNTRITLQGAIPNWCLAASGHSATDPGPGAYPQPVPTPPHKHRHEFPTNKVDAVIATKITGGNPEGLVSAVAPDSGHSSPYEKRVNVVIFDTAPPREVLDAAYLRNNKLPDSDPAKNDLLHRIEQREKHGQFTIKYADQLPTPIILPPNLKQDPEDHNELHGYSHRSLYDMSDHGLFIAGIICDHVPADNMNLYLVETQNNYGVGTIASLAHGIEALINGDIIKDGMDAPLIVNCSLCISFKTPQELRDVNLDVSTEIDFKKLTPAQIAKPEIAELRSLYDLMSILDTFASGGVRMIAAAGNDSTSTDPKYTPEHARYPAAFDIVLGVGAIDNAGNRMFYSNLADVPPKIGLMVFGGQAQKGVDKNITDTTGDGMLGLYVGSFPDSNTPKGIMPPVTPSTNGWAWWAGTSFSTAVMTGMFARAASKGRDIRRGAANDFRDQLEKNRDRSTNQGEPCIKTPQRP